MRMIIDTDSGDSEQYYVESEDKDVQKFLTNEVTEINRQRSRLLLSIEGQSELFIRRSNLVDDALNQFDFSNKTIFVKFKDYGFFMPKDISGREVVMHGKAFFRVTPVEELRHYAEDAGKSADEIAQITEAKRELSFLADGVILVD